MKVIKVIGHTGLNYPGYGAEVQDKWATGTHDECVKKIKEDLLFNLDCEYDSGSIVFQINDAKFCNDLTEMDATREDVERYTQLRINGHEDEIALNILRREKIRNYINGINDAGAYIVLRMQEDDVYSSVYELTYCVKEE